MPGSLSTTERALVCSLAARAQTRLLPFLIIGVQRVLQNESEESALFSSDLPTQGSRRIVLSGLSNLFKVYTIIHIRLMNLGRNGDGARELLVTFRVVISEGSSLLCWSREAPGPRIISASTMSDTRAQKA
ncbi:hypothetical protein GX51_04882 [Blastomyces parvus]|uniref:Uncharacterized protein n=1 Tax=Blastomyces parvus TaxID=2060905 RepID=A0A2B7WZP8_9EURO|nr:hypothetical protein GX51_04882 [Blastomyces parvus]